MSIPAYAAPHASASLRPFQIERRSPSPQDVIIDIHYCGVCHSDIHQARNEWGNAIFPMVPGHEITGYVKEVGSAVSRFKKGDPVGVGCFTDSCRHCHACQEGAEPYCEKGMTLTYNGLEKDGKTPTYGGYSTEIVVDQAYVLKIPENLSLAEAAPLLCAGITTYSPLRHWQVKPGSRVAVIGLGGLGHMAVKLAAAMKAEVTVFSHSPQKKADALNMGAKHFVLSSDTETLNSFTSYFDFMINTVSATIDLNTYLNLLRLDGSLILVGVPDHPFSLQPFSLIRGRKSLAGSLIGGIKETQEMLAFCGEHQLAADIEIIPIQKINEAYERMIRGEIRYRFVIDLASLKTPPSS